VPFANLTHFSSHPAKRVSHFCGGQMEAASGSYGAMKAVFHRLGKSLGGCLLVWGMGACAGLSGGNGDTSTRVLGPDGTIITIGGENKKRERAGRRDRRGQEGSTSVVAAPVVPQGWWNSEGITGPPSITIDLGEQKAFFKRGGKIVGMSPISSGREGYRTPAGSFRISQKSRDHVSNLYGDYVDAAGNVVVANVGVRRDPRPAGTRFRGASMPYFLRIHGAVGIHAGYLPGYPASSGCIRLPEDMARLFYENSSHGTPVLVKR
jgi:hypothetical protein